MAERFNIQSQLEHMQMKFVGTGHADTSKAEWLSAQHKDSYASYVGHPALLAYFATAQNQSLGRVRYQMMQRLCKPCQETGKPNPNAATAAGAGAAGAAPTTQ
jgi:splicing factor 3B subunit 5